MKFFEKNKSSFIFVILSGILIVFNCLGAYSVKKKRSKTIILTEDITGRRFLKTKVATTT